MPLPEAYRSLSRPSSPVGTKASTVCPIKLDSMFEISRFLERNPDCSAFFLLTRRCRHRRCRKKFDVWESEYIQGPQERLMGLFSHLLQSFLQSIKSYYSPYGCQRASLFAFLVRLWAQRFTERKMVGLIGLEPMTPALSRRCSNQLSYRPLLRLSFEGQALAELAVVKGCLQAMACHS